MGIFGDKKKEDDQEEEIEQEDSTYDASVECDNCGAEFDIEITKGTTKIKFLKNKTCEECGCVMLQEEHIIKDEEDE